MLRGSPRLVQKAPPAAVGHVLIDELSHLAQTLFRCSPTELVAMLDVLVCGATIKVRA